MARRSRLPAAIAAAFVVGILASGILASPRQRSSAAACHGNGVNKCTTSTSTTVATTTAPTTTTVPTTTVSTTWTVPSSIASDCSVDVSAALLSWLATVPDNSTVSFASNGCYRVESTLELRNRAGLDFEGNGATLESLNAPDDQRAIWRFVDSTNIGVHHMRLLGSYAAGGTFNSSLQHAHGIDARGTSIDIGQLDIERVAGDCVYFGLGYTAALTKSSGSFHDSTCAGTSRSAVSVTAGQNITVTRINASSLGFDVFDVEPNTGPGWGADNVAFTDNQIGSYHLYAFSIIENAPITNQSFTGNTVSGQGLRIGILAISATYYRAAGVTISGNTSDTPQQPPAVEVHNVDGITVTNNTIPLVSGTLVTLDATCNATVNSNIYTGGTTEVTTTSACPTG